MSAPVRSATSGLLVIVGAAALVGAFAAGRLYPAARAPVANEDRSSLALAEEVRRLRAEVEALSRSRSTGRAGASPEQLQTAMREELARVEGERHAREREPLPPPRQTPEFAGSVQLVDVAIAAQSWTDEDRDHLRAVLPQLDRSQRRAVLTKLLAAINDGRVRLQTEGGPI